MNNKKTILFKPLDSDELFIQIVTSDIEPFFKRTYQVHSDSIEDFKDIAKHPLNRIYFDDNTLNLCLNDGIEIDSELVEIKEYHVPYKTLLTANNVKDIIPEVVDLAVYKEPFKETIESIKFELNIIKEERNYLLNMREKALKYLTYDIAIDREKLNNILEWNKGNKLFNYD